MSADSDEGDPVIAGENKELCDEPGRAIGGGKTIAAECFHDYRLQYDSIYAHRTESGERRLYEPTLDVVIRREHGLYLESDDGNNTLCLDEEGNPVMAGENEVPCDPGLTRDPSGKYSRPNEPTCDPQMTRPALTRESNKSSTRNSGKYSEVIRITNESRILAHHITYTHLTQGPFMPGEHPQAIAQGHSAVHEAGTEGGEVVDVVVEVMEGVMVVVVVVVVVVVSSLSLSSSSAAVAKTAAAGPAQSRDPDPPPGMQPRWNQTPQRLPDNRQSGRGDNRRTLGGVGWW
ncbi:hypothetical protein BDZ89DRAFT_1120404 [Hymenopellis radicata]|nr:hypothetical protein BDZ89DRAFT_1120404 [Hymenopellis radicata]